MSHNRQDLAKVLNIDNQIGTVTQGNVIIQADLRQTVTTA